MEKKIKGFVAGLVIIGILFSLNIATFGESVKKASEPVYKSNLRGNLINGGFVADTAEYVFYSNIDGLFSMKKDGGKPKIISKYLASNINIVGNYIYCSLFNGNYDKYLGFFKIRTDGKDLKKISDCYLEYANVVDGWIYFINTSSIYKMKIDGTFKKSIGVKNVLKLCVENNSIYYIEKLSYSLYKIDMNGKKTKKLATNVQELASADSYVYYHCTLVKDIKSGKYKSGIFKVGNNDKSSLVFDEKAAVYIINVFNGWIYYTGVNTKEIKRIKVDGTKSERICTNEFDVRYDINVIEDWVFYSCNYYRDKIKFYKIKVDGSDKQELSSDEEVATDLEGVTSFHPDYFGVTLQYPKGWELVENRRAYLIASFYPIRGNDEDVYISLINPEADFGQNTTIYDIQEYYNDPTSRDSNVVIDESKINVTEQNTEIFTFSSHVISEDKSNKEFNNTVIIKNGNRIVGLHYYALTNDLQEKYTSAFKDIRNSLTLN